MPTPGVIDTAYVDSFVETVELLEANGLLVLIDLHQDGWGPSLGSNGFPEWMTLTHGAENTGTPFPLYYLTNPAIQVAFDSFWANEKGPGDVPLQDRVATVFDVMAQRLAGSDAIWVGTCSTSRGLEPTSDRVLRAAPAAPHRTRPHSTRTTRV